MESAKEHLRCCPKCGMPIKPSDKYCGNCGARLIDTTIPSTSSPYTRVRGQNNFSTGLIIGVVIGLIIGGVIGAILMSSAAFPVKTVTETVTVTVTKIVTRTASVAKSVTATKLAIFTFNTIRLMAFHSWYNI